MLGCGGRGFGMEFLNKVWMAESKNCPRNVFLGGGSSSNSNSRIKSTF